MCAFSDRIVCNSWAHVSMGTVVFECSSLCLCSGSLLLSSVFLVTKLSMSDNQTVFDDVYVVKNL